MVAQCLCSGSLQLFAVNSWQFSSVWSAVNVKEVRDTALFSPFRIHFEKLKQIPVLKLDASVEFKSDPEVQEQFITKVCLNTYWMAFIPKRCYARVNHTRALLWCCESQSSTLGWGMWGCLSQSADSFLYGWCLMCFWYAVILVCCLSTGEELLWCFMRGAIISSTVGNRWNQSDLHIKSLYKLIHTDLFLMSFWTIWCETLTFFWGIWMCYFKTLYCYFLVTF